MQTLDIISINLWQTIISLLNLLLIFLILKKFFYKPVQKVLSERRAILDKRYAEAEKAENEALANKTQWEEKMQGAEENAEAIIKEATVRAERRSEKIIEEAKEKADVIVRGAQAEALLERKKATEGIKREIVDVSSCLSEKILEREIKKEDHQKLIDSFISEIGDGNE
jgi:F-type H+-transporting ATPase subunit b